MPNHMSGRAGDAHSAMPTPELYMMYAMIANSDAMMAAMKKFPVGNVHHVNLAKQMHRVFGYKAMKCVCGWVGGVLTVHSTQKY